MDESKEFFPFLYRKGSHWAIRVSRHWALVYDTKEEAFAGWDHAQSMVNQDNIWDEMY